MQVRTMWTISRAITRVSLRFPLQAKPHSLYRPWSFRILLLQCLLSIVFFATSRDRKAEEGEYETSHSFEALPRIYIVINKLQMPQLPTFFA
jgi:hypothetical protein